MGRGVHFLIMIEAGSFYKQHCDIFSRLPVLLFLYIYIYMEDISLKSDATMQLHQTQVHIEASLICVLLIDLFQVQTLTWLSFMAEQYDQTFRFETNKRSISNS